MAETKFKAPLVMMDGFGVKEIESLAEVTKDMAGSYFKAKPQEEGLVDWLGDALKKWVPGNLAVGMADDIVSGVDEFNRNLAELNGYCEAGKYKETWLRDKLREPMDGMDNRTQGEYLTQVQDALMAGNAVLTAAVESEQNVSINAEAIVEGEVISEGNQKIEWDRQMLGMVGTDIANQANLMAAAMATSPAGAIMALQNVEGSNLTDENIADTDLGSGLDRGLKVIAAGALNVCAVAGKIPILRDVAAPVLTNVACVGVEGVKALARFGQGKITATQAIDRIERAVTAGVVGIIRKGTKLGKKVLSKIPVIGATIGTAVATVVGKVAEKKVGELIHKGIEMIKPVARVALETAKAVVTKAVETVKNVGKKVLSFFGF